MKHKPVNFSDISSFEGPQESPGFLLWKVSTQWRKAIEAELSLFNLTHPQFVLLASIGWLTKENAHINQAGLASHCGMDPATTSQVIRNLKKKGFVERYQKGHDERAKYVRLTQPGVAMVNLTLPKIEEVDKIFFEAVDNNQTIKLLKKLSVFG